uniref:Uncharacterized protein n=1 Tax=Varanus komodoensis TaxID=61221 RepID=A0A8D2KXY6_VARKO
MGTGKCSKGIGIALLPLAVCAIISNLLLYFPNGEVLEPRRITDLVWFFHGILGAGILVGERARCHDVCSRGLSLFQVVLSILFAILGAAGGVYCVIISSLGLISGPLCDVGGDTSWSICKTPENIVLWNTILFSLLLAIGTAEAILCLAQLVNVLVGAVGSSCLRKRKSWNGPQSQASSCTLLLLLLLLC